MNYYERHIGDYIKDAAHLTLLEHGIYGRLLDIYYSRESAIPADQVARLVGARSEEERGSLACVLGEFFTLDDGHWRHKRCDEEIARFKAKQAQAQRAAAASVASRQASAERPLNARSAPVEPALNVPSNQTPVTSNQQEKEKRPRKARATPLPDAFILSARVETWAAQKGYHPDDVAQQTEAFLSYVKRKGAVYADWDEALMTAIREDWAKCRTQPATETAYQRSMRERAAEAHPAIARPAPGQTKPHPMEALDGLTRIAG